MNVEVYMCIYTYIHTLIPKPSFLIWTLELEMSTYALEQTDTCLPINKNKLSFPNIVWSWMSVFNAPAPAPTSNVPDQNDDSSPTIGYHPSDAETEYCGNLIIQVSLYFTFSKY